MEEQTIWQNIPSYKPPETPRSAFFTAEVAKNLPRVKALREKREAGIAALVSPTYVPPMKLPSTPEDRDMIGALLIAFAAENAGEVKETDLGFEVIFETKTIGKLRVFYDPTVGALANKFHPSKSEEAKKLDLHPAPEYKTGSWMFSPLTWRGYRTTNLFEAWSMEVSRIISSPSK